MTNTYIKSLFLGLALCFTTATVNATGNAPATSSGQESTEKICGVSEQQIVEYMNDYGYIVLRMEPIPGSCSVRVDTQYAYDTIVYIEGGCIVDHEDML